jgi:hypothetical protein
MNIQGKKMWNSRPRLFFGGTGFPACAGAGEGACSSIFHPLPCLTLLSQFFRYLNKHLGLISTMQAAQPDR